MSRTFDANVTLAVSAWFTPAITSSAFPASMPARMRSNGEDMVSF
jgi:hypothetical protein